MTQQDDITQRLRDNADLDEAEHGNARVVQLEREAANEIERLRALLSKLRAEGVPVAGMPEYITDNRYHIQYRLGWNNCLSDCRAAMLAAAPVASAPADERALTAQQRKEFIRRASFISEADRDTRAAFVDEIARAALASAPVAGEARSIGYIDYQGRNEGHARVVLTTGYDEHGDSWPEGTKIYAAPQASEAAAAVRTLQAKGYTYHGGEQWKPPLGDAAATVARLDNIDAYRIEAMYLLREARALLPAFTTAEEIGAWWEKVRKFGAGDVLDVPPKADKDGGQQRACTCHPDDRPAGDCQQQYAATDCQQRAKDTFPEHPLPVFSEGKWTWGETGQAFSHTEMDEAAFVVYRAALSATQTEQGEN